jgi:predicted dehydrogenase
MLRGPIIGYGNVAKTGHMPFWRACPDAEIVAVVDNDPARRALFVANDPRRRSYTVLADLLAAERLDFVDICTSPSSHAALIEQALTAKLHVLCEKLLTIAADDTSGSPEWRKRPGA